MKEKLLLLVIGSAIVGLSTAPAHASNGTLTFEGEIVSNTCHVVAGTENQTIRLPSVNATHFTGLGSTAARTRFTVTITGCTVATTARVFYEASANNIDYTQNALRNLDTTLPGGARGIGFALWDETNGNRISLGMAAQGTAFRAAPAGAATQLGYEVAYVQYEPTMTPGVVRGQVEYSIQYQ